MRTVEEGDRGTAVSYFFHFHFFFFWNVNLFTNAHHRTRIHLVFDNNDDPYPANWNRDIAFEGGFTEVLRS